MAKKKTKKNLLTAEAIIDPAYRDHYEAQIRFNDFLNTSLAITATGNVTNQGTNNYAPSTGVLVIDRPDLGGIYTLDGNFNFEAYPQPEPSEFSIFLYGKNTSYSGAGLQYVLATGSVVTLPVGQLPEYPLTEILVAKDPSENKWSGSFPSNLTYIGGTFLLQTPYKIYGLTDQVEYGTIIKDGDNYTLEITAVPEAGTPLIIDYVDDSI